MVEHVFFFFYSFSSFSLLSDRCRSDELLWVGGLSYGEEEEEESIS